MFYFAWQSTGDTVFGVEHEVVDEHVFSFEIDHKEGDFASLTVEIINPNVGLLSAGRDKWVWFSWKKPDDTVVPLFHGALVGVPENMDKKVITLVFRARPEDYEEQKAALAETLKVYPYWDPIWISEDEIENPDVVLEARPEAWHIDRITNEVTVSNFLAGEDGTFSLGQDDLLNETLQVTYGAEPIRHIHVEATVSWDQFSVGTVDLSQKIEKAFQEAGSGAYMASSYTGQGLQSSWPRFSDDIGGGWSVDESSVKLLSTADNASFIETPIVPVPTDPEDLNEIVEPPFMAHFYLWVFDPTFKVRYEATRGRTETISFDVLADMQDLLTETEAETVDLTVASDLVAQPVDPDEAVPIGDLGSNTYFNLDRADASIAYLLNLARSQILLSARAVEITFELPLALGVDLSCRHDIILTATGLPGGEAGGKIISYKLTPSTAFITMGCCIGKGNSLAAPEDGEPTYVEEGYVNDWQHYSGASLQPVPGELSYDDFVIPIVDDGLDFGNMTPDSVIADTAASALFTMTTAGTADQTVTVGARTYTFKAALSGANQVLLGADEDATTRNLADALNATEDKLGVTVGAGTVAHADVSGEAGDGILRATARVAGPGGNSIAVSDTSSTGSWATATLVDGDDGLVVNNGPSVQSNVLNETYATVDAAIDALNLVFTEVELALKPVTGGPFENLYTLTVSELMVPKTIDLEAA